MNYWLVAILSLCILIPATIGLIRFSKINRAYYPFIYCIWLGALIEIINNILVLIAIFIITWISENFIISKITYFSSYFIIEYSFILVMMSITIINRLIIMERNNILKNPTFLLCIAFVFYYTLQTMVEAFWVYGINDTNFSNNVFNISVITNFITNLLYTVAIIWIPTRQKFTLPSS
jgi:hypothetical protein